MSAEQDFEVQDCVDPNCVNGVSWHVESEHSPYCDCETDQTTCPVPVQVQHECPWPGHRIDRKGRYEPK